MAEEEARIDFVVGRAVLEATPPKVVVDLVADAECGGGLSVLLSSRVGKAKVIPGFAFNFDCSIF